MDVNKILHQCCTNFLIKNGFCDDVAKPNQQTADKLHKPIIRNLLNK